MPAVNNLNAFLGAAVLGVIGAAGMFLVEQYRQNRVRHAMAQDLARLDQELSQVRRELNQLLSKKTRKTKGRNSSNRANSVASGTTIDDSNVESSDMEYFDVSDDEPDLGLMDLEQALNIIDVKLDSGSLHDLQDSLIELGDLGIEYPGNPELLWRLGKAHQKISEKSNVPSIIEEHISKGIQACSQALKLKDDSANIHKWYAILIGSRSDFVSLQEKISDGHIFKKHVDAALALCPTDPSLHHMLGRFDFEVASLKWYERKVAAALFGEPPNSTIPEALEHFMEAERLSNFDWKENKLMIAKCKIACGDYKEGVDWLQKASNCREGVAADDKVDAEVEELLKKYNSYR
ncbi:regulator of microtubule dynamics protein 1 [Leptinotarsa decemlineata]|uniref:regulator of microtubule dynamics protein 1 n=1 Tax=Leptinotarsa decemlineata TaxID=7539 RepID=UPI000C251E22|nr:regulator of microtubule dynamics protein 2-like [Leptinotarsa decemlineata]XP_023019668.1 regulator of microtubule dynamics protein 2-like [Leptinotarsa decemlineata]